MIYSASGRFRYDPKTQTFSELVLDEKNQTLTWIDHPPLPPEKKRPYVPKVIKTWTQELSYDVF